ncbi:hypothetical protein [Bacillus mesophilum]|uniref:Uncharacterized protein n=1 Tax=Bacillus mesophilum TaxID=1071718 RepID=A0A7V7UWT8_9BACI|nr:hypothetical protein [Bacillus mesophilum]KAB2334269.1 hypothetical protein F7732_09370 [Bacillus mesophilum]
MLMSEMKKEMDAPLLQVELDTFDSVPKVFYKGEEITNRISVKLEWKTKDHKAINNCSFEIVHAENTNENDSSIRTISHNSFCNR